MPSLFTSISKHHYYLAFTLSIVITIQDVYIKGLGAAATVPISTFVTRPGANRKDVFQSRSKKRLVKIRPTKQFNGHMRKFNTQCRTVRTSSTSLLSSLTNHFAAGGTLFLSTLIGVLFDKFSKKSGGGHVITLLSAAMLSNLSQAIQQVPRIPTDHFLYDWCWSIFLPASLVFALLSSSSPNGMLADDDEMQSTETSKVTRQCIQGMAIPFVLGSFGSILGCMASFFSVQMPTSTPVAAKSTITSAILAGCLCSSYIGGTVNFFAAGRILTPLSSSNDMGNIFGSMAAADLVVMALYFAMLSAASKSSWLQQLFPSSLRHEVAINDHDKSDTSDSQTAPSGLRSSILYNSGAVSISIFMALSSVLVATRLENVISNQFSIPGTMCAFLAVFGMLYDKLIRLSLNAMHKTSIDGFIQTMLGLLQRSFERIHVVAPSLGDLSFFLLFAAVGTTADVSSAVLGGPLALMFATLALMVHTSVLLLGTFIGSKVTQAIQKFSYTWPQSTWEEVLTASNAAIGGPSTAAAFAAGLVKSDGSYRRALVISATIYGVFGYAIGTSIGVLLTKFLLRLIS